MSNHRTCCCGPGLSGCFLASPCVYETPASITVTLAGITTCPCVRHAWDASTFRWFELLSGDPNGSYTVPFFVPSGSLCTYQLNVAGVFSFNVYPDAAGGCTGGVESSFSGGLRISAAYNSTTGIGTASAAWTRPGAGVFSSTQNFIVSGNVSLACISLPSFGASNTNTACPNFAGTGGTIDITP